MSRGKNMIRERLRIAEVDKQLNGITATVHYTEQGFPRQKQITATSEEALYEQVFWFKAEHYPQVIVKMLQYNGQNVVWDDRLGTYSHYCFGKGRMSFAEFKKLIFEEEVKETA